jgi:Fe-S cluster assembly protein SufD
MPLRRIEPAADYGRLFDEVKGRLAGDPRRREASFARFRELGFPNQRAEAWKYTSLKALAENAPAAPEAIAVTLADLEPYLLTGDVKRLVFVNGFMAPELSDIAGLPAGLTVASFDERVTHEGALLADADAERSLTALNAAMAHGGAVVEVADGTDVSPTLQLVFVQAGDAGGMANPRNVVRVGAGAKLTMAETWVALGVAGVTNVVNDFDVAEAGELTIDKLQFGRGRATLIGRSAMRVAQEGRLAQTTVTAGGGLVRNETFARLEGPKADLDLNGAYMPVKGEHVDTSIRIEHRAPDCPSNQFYKGILAPGGHGVFAGKIFVDQVAQRTNAYQQNDNLMLARDAEIDTKPELEIYADDVKCSHGATVGELDDVGLFYLRSRGIDKETAQAILTFAFAGEVIERLAHEDSRHQARRALLARLAGGEKLAELV